ncbi:sphingomyelin phosphodiesterase 4, neutral membrane (neutral sphingomyelinase-3) [Modicella reniformis]|uniref:Sphingomyelin phosphodiesterase 4, neutral membrane (Neutral sphingomyelinase-3) n=1 Tax=Modicella reniformis TaxID=1440133 RepID=A0A9P6LTQ7_9FUNG|nr:sphingomyelin phosphodiesterase 4, neutral membrane (neutral sphingomyelinase-3) [Modicella reniformis]
MSFEGLDRLLVGSVQTACANLTNHLNQCFDSDVHAKSFYEFLPRLCQILFGSKESRGWLHLLLSKAEEDPLYELLRPRGALMRFLLNRYTDNGFIYEMVPDSLPKRTQSKLDPTQYLALPPIYLSRVNLVKTTAPVGAQKTMAQITKVNLNFNMLEYFLFYFAYALTLDDDDCNGRGMRRTDPKLAFRISGPPPGATAPGATRSPGWVSGSLPKAPLSRVLVDGSFFNLYHQYLHYFIPAPERAKNTEPTTTQRPLNVFNDHAIENSTDKQQTQLSISEFFIGTIVELWLGQNDKTVDNRTVRYVQPGSDIADCITTLISHLLAHDISPYVLGGDLVPSHVTDSTGKSVHNLAGIARRSAYQYIRPQLYTFLRMGLQFWPLDDAFPSLVDTWMTWITPWRYGRRDPPTAGDVVSAKWQPYVFDNFLFYTTLLDIYLPRLSHPPQTSRPLGIGPPPLTLSKELRSINKVMRVFKAQNLKEILKIAEQALVWPENFPDSSYTGFEGISEGGLGAAGSIRQDPTSAFLSSMVNALQRQLQQLEGHQYKYEALFLVEGPNRSKIRMLLTKLGNAVDVRQEKLSALEAKNKQAAEQSASWSAILSAINNMVGQPPPKTAPVDPVVYVRELKAIRDIMSLVGEVFDLYPNVVTLFEKQHQSAQEGGSTLTAEELEALIPPLEEPESSGLLEPGKRRKYVPQGLVREPIDGIKGLGPRAEQLVLTYESEVLVKLTRQAEEYLTSKVRVFLLLVK